MKRIVLGFLVPVTILGAAGFGAATLVRTAESAEREVVETPPPLVEVTTVSAATTAPLVVGTGVVESAREVSLSAELSGKIVSVSDKLVVGGRVKAGDTLVRLDGRNYELAVRERRAQVEQAQAELEIEEGRGALARTEWKTLAKDVGGASGRLALREPQAESASVAVESARAALERAELDRGRTSIRAPFNATVIAESVDVGQVVAPGATIATLVGTDEFWVHVAVRVEELGFIAFPHGDRPGSEVRITANLGGGRAVERTGRVVRLVNEVDRESRMAKVIVAVERPLDSDPGELPLLRGAFVEATITGHTTVEAVAVPRTALVDGHRVWVVDAADTIHPRELQIAWKSNDTVYVTDSLRPGDRVVVGKLPTPVEGAKVRPLDQAKLAKHEGLGAEQVGGS